MTTWEQAWQAALYGEGGFYRREEGPAGHFTTSAHEGLGPVFAEAIAALADRHAVCRVVDFAAGRGELLGHLATLRPDLALLGVDVVARPPWLPGQIGWMQSPGGGGLPEALVDLEDTLLIANEWLDVVPCPIYEVDADGALRELLTGAAPGAADREWIERWWPMADAEPGDRVEVGRTRDQAWEAVLERLTSGHAYAIDYGHTAARRPHAGTLTAYRSGELTDPVADGSCDLTAHVAMDSLRHDTLDTQRELLGELLPPRPVDPALAHTDPLAYVQSLSAGGARATLRAPGGLGDFLWAGVAC